MNSPTDPRQDEADVFRDFAMACRIERDRLSLAEIAEQDRRFDGEASSGRSAEQFATASSISSAGARAADAMATTDGFEALARQGRRAAGQPAARWNASSTR
jgi:hypothetical protein